MPIPGRPTKRQLEQQQQQQKLQWKKGKTTVSLYVSGKKHKQEVSALILGNLAVHQLSVGDVREYLLWRITSTNTGSRICMVQTKEDAQRIAEILHVNYAEVFALKSEREIILKTPRKVVLWLRECLEKEAYIPPEGECM